MDIDPPGSPKSGKKPHLSLGRTPTPKPKQATPRSGHLARAFIVHGVACYGPWQAYIQEVEVAFRRKGGESLVCGGSFSSIGEGEGFPVGVSTCSGDAYVLVLYTVM